MKIVIRSIPKNENGNMDFLIVPSNLMFDGKQGEEFVRTIGEEYKEVPSALLDASKAKDYRVYTRLVTKSDVAARN